MCPIWLKMTKISFQNLSYFRIWTLISLFPILSPQSRSFIPLYEGVRDVANHRVKQLRVVLLKLSSNLNDCENDCGVVTMTKKVGFWFKSNLKCHYNVICQYEKDRKEQGLSPDLLQGTLETSHWRPLCLGLAGALRGPAQISNDVSSLSNEDTVSWMRILKITLSGEETTLSNS